MGKPGTTKMVNLGPKQKYGLKMDHSVNQMSKTDKGINYMMGAATPQMSKTDKGINYMMGAATKQYGSKMEGAMKKGCYGAKQMKTGLYQDRMDGKLPQNPMLMQYGMSDKAVKQVGKHIAMPQASGVGEGEDKTETLNRAVAGSREDVPMAGERRVDFKPGEIGYDDPDLKMKKYEVSTAKPSEKKMGNEKWKQFLASPEGKSWKEKNTKTRVTYEMPSMPGKGPAPIETSVKPRPIAPIEVPDPGTEKVKEKKKKSKTSKTKFKTKKYKTKERKPQYSTKSSVKCKKKGGKGLC